MKEKIAHLMKIEGLTTTRLAEILETQPSAVSHLISGRNKPSYDLLQKILRRFPQINPDWLLLDSDEPYRKEIISDDDDMVDDGAVPVADLGGDLHFGLSGAVADDHDVSEQGGGASPLFNILPPTSGRVKSPIFVVLFYDDGSCERFSMRNK